jgi:hypothetical protein
MLLIGWPSAEVWAQTAEVHPAVLSRVPNVDVAAGKFWQQLRLVLGADDAPSDSSVVVHLPPEIGLNDTNDDGRFEDEVRVLYEAADGEQPEFFVSSVSGRRRIVLGNSQAAAVGGRLYIQFPILSIDEAAENTTHYERILFADPRELDIQQGPQLNFVGVDEFSLLGAMNTVFWAPAFSPGTDTTTASLGDFFPDPATEVVLEVPDLVFDGGVGGGVMKMLPLALIRFLFRCHKAIKNRILRTWNKNRIGSERRFEGNFHQPRSVVPAGL